jgi:hypothetical protein
MPTNKQSGAALLAFLLIIVTGASYALVRELNASIRRANNGVETAQSLYEAKNALLGWAISHPTYPGTLPMPDRNGDGDYDGDSDCYNGGAIGNNLLLGKLPWREVSSPCKDAAVLPGLRTYALDSSGEQLWYAVSHNLIYETPEYPLISMALLDKNTDWITVRDKNGNVISDRVAFVVIAPGFTNENQDRSSATPAASNYLDSITIGGTCSAGVVTGGTTYDHSDTTNLEYVIYPDAALTDDDCDHFNDQLVFVTIDELMAGLKKRVLSEVSNMLSKYHNTNGALPWLTQFADPKSDIKALEGMTTSSSSNLIDTNMDFSKWDVNAGDIVWNLTDGSRGIVTAVSVNTLTIGAGLFMGVNNAFAIDDEYYVEIKDLSSALNGTATAGSSSFILEDTNSNFEVLDVRIGDVVENITDDSAGIVVSVDNDELTVKELVGGTNNTFTNSNEYKLRSNTGRTTDENLLIPLMLIDANADFISMGVKEGDLVVNITDSSYGRVATGGVTIDELTVDELLQGTTNTFSANDSYAISRFNGTTNTRRGLLSLHEKGGLISTGFNVDWKALDNGTSYANSTVANDPNYLTGIKNWTEDSSFHSNLVAIQESNAKCIWLESDLLNCNGHISDTDFLSGTNDLVTFGLNLVYDAQQSFIDAGVKDGDLVENTTTGVEGIVSETTSDTLTVTSISGQTGFSTSSGDSYRVFLSTSGISETVNLYNSTSNLILSYNDTYLDDIEVGDVIENLTDGGAVGLITELICCYSVAEYKYLRYSDLQGGVGSDGDLRPGESYIIHHDYVDRREYDLDLTYTGSVITSNSSGIRKRTVCMGYDNTCSTAINDATLLGDASTSFITVKDYDNNNVEISVATNTIPAAGLSNSSIKVSDLNYFLNEEIGDLPHWFVLNKWYQHVYVAYSAGEAPGGITCTSAASDCLVLNIGANVNDNVRALVMLSGEELSGKTWTTGSIGDYVDLTENTDANDIFEKQSLSSTFNDSIRVAISCPSDVSKLCWSG